MVSGVGTTLTVLAVADQVSPYIYDHFTPEPWSGVDLVLSCGDLPPEYLDFLCTQLNVPVFYVRGNHDCSYGLSQYDGCVSVHGRVVEYRGMRIAGFNGCRRYNRGGCQFSERQMRREIHQTRLHTLRHGLPDIVVTHAPPAGCHDGPDLCHRGFDCFRRLIEVWQPQVFVHGHTHGHYGSERISRLGATAVINAFPYRLFRVTPGARRIRVAGQSTPDRRELRLAP
ncbi:MAG TPA: metallophosphoesterase [Chloroflexota bacterium]|nr:metallophosphoesterase [Chloroflexota bacterium]